MIDFIPLDIYTPIFHYLILLMVLVTVMQGYSGILLNESTLRYLNVFGVVITIVLIFYWGLRPLSGRYFGDTSNYAYSYKLIQGGIINTGEDKEWVFNGMMRWFALSGFSIHVFFTFCTFLYFGLNWLAARKLFGNYYYVPYLVIMSMFVFIGYGMNGIRAGLSLTAMLIFMAYRSNYPVMILTAIFAYYTHNSSILLIVAAILALFIKNPKLYIIGWLLSIVLSLIVGNSFANFFVSIGLADDRLSSYLNSDIDRSVFSHTGFRWDFLAFSALPIIIGAYFIFKRNFKDAHYLWFYNVYLIANSFFVIVIRAAYANRFAQLSWVIMPIVLIYPFYKKRFWSNQSEKIGQAMILFYVFTFYYNILIPGIYGY